jgi:hypothetical protein
MVRWLPASSPTWFKSTDSLGGTNKYSTPNDPSQQWSYGWSTWNFDKTMVMTGNKAYMVSFTKTGEFVTSNMGLPAGQPPLRGSAISGLKWDVVGGMKLLYEPAANMPIYSENSSTVKRDAFSTTGGMGIWINNHKAPCQEGFNEEPSTQITATQTCTHHAWYNDISTIV